LVVKI
jgi:hypothetical protein